MASLQLTIATPLEEVYSGQVDQVTLSTEAGEITVLPNHVPMVSKLITGHVVARSADNETLFAIDGGLVEVRHDHSVVVLSDRSEHADAIDLERAEAAAQKAKEYMEKPQDEEVDYAQLQKILIKEQNRMKVARRGGRK